MQEIEAIVNAVAQQGNQLQANQLSGPVADPSQVAEFERLMNSLQSGGPAMDQYFSVQESPMQVASSGIFKIGTEASHSFQNGLAHFDAKMDTLDMSNPN